MLWTDTFETLVKFVQFSLTFCSFLAVLGVIVLRRTRPDLPRPYRVWAYPLPPLLFLAMSLFMMIYLLREQPREALIGVGIMLTGLLIYFVSRLVGPSPLAQSGKTAMDPSGR
jgi:APA family basic amino acid/polyamine antiporter